MNARSPGRRPVLPGLLLGVAAGLQPLPAQAQSYPNQLVRLVVAATPGTSMDIIARALGPSLSQRLGQPVVVENRAGASGAIGAEYVAKSVPDGHTLMIAAQSLVVVPHLNRKLAYNPLTDFAPVGLIAYGTLMLVATAGSNLNTVADVIAMARSRPGAIAYASPGVGLPQHLAMELFQDVAGIQLLHVPYKGSAGALSDLIGGHVILSLFPLQVAMPQVKAGKLRGIAVPSAKRHPTAPVIPTFQESGVGGVDSIATLSNFMVAPRGTPAAVVTRLNDELRVILDIKSVRSALENDGLDVATSTPDQLFALMQRASAVAEAIIRKSNLSIP